MDNKDIFAGQWDDIKVKMKQAWSKLSDEDFNQIKGSHQVLFGKLQKHYGYSRHEAEKIVRMFQEKSGF